MGQLRAALPAGGRPLRAALAAGALVVGLALGLAGIAVAQAEPSELSEAAVIERDAAVEVWVRLSRPAKYRSDLIDSPWRLVLDFEDTAYKWSASPVPVGIDPVRELRGSQFRKGAARLVIELRRKVAYTIEQDREGLRIVLPREGRVQTTPASKPVSASKPVAAPRPEPMPKPAPAPKPAPSPKAAAEVTPAPKVGPAGPAVRGIIVLEEQAHAYIFDPATKQVRRYAVGDPVGDAVVETIGDRHVVLKTPTGRVELHVGDVRPDGAPGPPPARPR